jgi:hypothetical protein
MKFLLQPDKALHFLVCYGAVLTFEKFIPLLYAAGVVLVLGALKEWYDREHPPHQAEWNDFWADCIGIGLAASVVYTGAML